jgi:hypothetical protein
MKAFIRGGFVAVATAGLLVSMAGAGTAATKPKKQSPAKYAKTVCGTYSQLETDIGNFATAIGALDPSNPATYTSQAATQTTTLLSTIQAAETKLAGAYPDVSNGKKIGQLLVTNATELDKTLSTALQQLQSSSSVAGPTLFRVAIQILPTKLSDPFSKITDQGLISAFKKEKSCSNVVQVTGG